MNEMSFVEERIQFSPPFLYSYCFELSWLDGSTIGAAPASVDWGELQWVILLYMFRAVVAAPFNKTYCNEVNKLRLTKSNDMK